MHFDRNISKTKYGKKSEDIYLFCVMKDEFYFSSQTLLVLDIPGLEVIGQVRPQSGCTSSGNFQR